MKKSILFLALAFAGSLTLANAQDAKKMSASKSISENIAKVQDLSSINQGLKGTAIEKKLESSAEFTFFAITNAGFDKTLLGGTQKMLNADNRGMLEKILNFHTVAGKLTIQDLKNKIAQGNGVAILKTLNGESLKCTLVNGNIVLSDTTKHSANIVESDLNQKNGIVHIIDAMLLPEVL